MKKTHTSADLHLGHTNIIRYCNRPFSSVEEMDETIINNINEKIMPEDRFIILGDFAWGTKVEHYLDLINCKDVWFVMGNHDRGGRKKPSYLESLEFYRKMPFTHVFGYYEEEIIIPGKGKKMITMSHYPMSSWNKSHRESWHLYGHVHGGMTKQLGTEPGKYRMDVGVDCHNFYPVAFDDLETLFSKVKWKDPLEGKKRWKKNNESEEDAEQTLSGERFSSTMGEGEES